MSCLDCGEATRRPHASEALEIPTAGTATGMASPAPPRASGFSFVDAAPPPAASPWRSRHAPLQWNRPRAHGCGKVSLGPCVDHGLRRVGLRPKRIKEIGCCQSQGETFPVRLAKLDQTDRDRHPHRSPRPTDEEQGSRFPLSAAKTYWTS